MLYVIGQGSHADVIAGILPPATRFVTIRSEDLLERLTTFDADDTFICALGDNAKRQALVQQAQTVLPPDRWINAIHVAAVVADNVILGCGNVIGAGAVIQTHAHIGHHCIINTHASIDHHGHVGDFVHVAPNAAVCGNVRIGEGVMVGTSASVMPKLTLAPWTVVKAGTLVKQSTGPLAMYQPFLKPAYTAELQAVADAGALTALTPHRSFVNKGEALLCQRLQSRFALLVNNGTSATHCLFLALKYKYPQLRKIYLPNHVYVAVWNAARYEYAPAQLEVLPVDPHTLNMPEDAEFLQSLDRDAALVVVHNVGNVVHVPRLRALRPDLIVVEDNCEGLFGRHGESFTGTQSFCASVSFFANKTITSGEGGAFLTQDEDVYRYIRKVHSQGQTDERYVHDVLGYNYRLTNVQAALLVPQLEDVSCILDRKREVFRWYKEAITHPRVTWPVPPAHPTEPACWMVIVRIRGAVYASAQAYFADRCIETRPLFYDVHRHAHLRDLVVPARTAWAPDEWVMLPSYPGLTLPQIQYIGRTVDAYAASLFATK